MTNWWISFSSPEEMMPTFEYHGPWWVSGSFEQNDKDHLNVCLAIRAETEEEAKNKVVNCFDNGNEQLIWRFCEEHSDDWSPFSDRFRRSNWMVWPN